MASQKTLSVPRILGYTSIKTKRDLYNALTSVGFFFVFTILATSIVSYLIAVLTVTLEDGSTSFEQSSGLIWAGILLGTVSFSAIFVDPLLAWLQKRVSQRILMLTALMGLMGTVGIFLMSFIPAFQWIVFIIIAAFLYGWSFDLYDITMTNVVLKGVKPSIYAQSLSQKRLAEVIGMMGGLLCSGFILYYGNQVSLVILLITFLVLFWFVRRNFDQESYADVSLVYGSSRQRRRLAALAEFISDPSAIAKELRGLGQSAQEQIMELSENTKNALVALPSQTGKLTQDLLEASRLQLIDILAKEDELKAPKKESPKEDEIEESGGVNSAEALAGMRQTLNLFWGFFSHPKGREVVLMWLSVVIIFFSFWDTMAVTFQPLFFAELAQENPAIRLWGGFIMAGFIVPILILQVPMSKLADKYGKHYFVFAGIVISGISLLLLGSSQSLWGIIVAGLSNSVGYALAFSSAQGAFMEYAKMILKPAQESLGAGAMRISMNIGNVLGQMAGGVIFGTLGFQLGFLSFGVLLVGYAVFSFYLITRHGPLFADTTPKRAARRKTRRKKKAGGDDAGSSSPGRSATAQKDRKKAGGAQGSDGGL